MRSLLLAPNVRFYGPITTDSVKDCLRQIDAALEGDKPLVFEMTTEGGDAEGGRRIACEIRLARELRGRDTYFLGKTAVMSAGATIMAAFPQSCRYLTRDTLLLLHERRLQKTVRLEGPIHAEMQMLRELLAELESAERIERDGFAEFAAGSRISAEDLYQRALGNYYLTAQEALDLNLIAGLL